MKFSLSPLQNGDVLIDMDPLVKASFPLQPEIRINRFQDQWLPELANDTGFGNDDLSVQIIILGAIISLLKTADFFD